MKFENVLMLGISIAIVLILFGVNVVVHELGHYYYGTSVGGKCYMFYTTMHGEVMCKFPASIDMHSLVMFSLSGMLAEIILYSVLTAIPLVSIIGGSMFLNFGVSFVTGRYDYDLMSIGVLRDPFMDLLVMSMSALMFIISILYTYIVVDWLNKG